jgi:hypothetical protein
MAADNQDARRNRDDDLKPGSPPRPATEPQGASGSSRNAKTDVDPATGEPPPGAPAPAAAVSDDLNGPSGKSD